MSPNPFLAAIRAGERPQIGLWLGLASPVTAEICAGAGFDWLLLDGEHGPNDVPLLLGQLQAIAPYASHPIGRLPEGSASLIKQYLDIGFQTLLVPMIESAEAAAQVGRAARYPPAGMRGVGSALARAARWNRTPGYLAAANAEVCVLVQVETAAGLERLDDIAAVEGVDGVFIGPSDLAAALGHIGDAAHPEVRREVEAAARRIAAAGKPAGILGTSQDAVRAYLAFGYRFAGVGIDTLLLRDAADRLRSAYAD
ncbi:MAG TPA: HpcH/HpaI aldolase/citrate lyase family protein [Caulobacteraceae bacterium]|nr:HpcH/HpaI aldolase/citrate lyase family protein [Caulobacteraceae bacterium]